MKKVIFGMFLFILWNSSVFAQLAQTETGLTVNVKILGINSESGMAVVQLVDEKNKTIAYKGYKPDNSGEITASFANLKPGRYAVRYFHDENENKKLDRNEQNFPVEGYGFSNNVGVFGPPKFEELLFNVSDNTNIKISTVYHF